MALNLATTKKKMPISMTTARCSKKLIRENADVIFPHLVFTLGGEKKNIVTRKFGAIILY